ncbi:MAG: peroxide stress protein YaaA [Proteobacteria bacterium]|nr:peroxide stress protein YaaA [Pseudomonadota bacterium]
MITLLSPSKGQDFESEAATDVFSSPELLDHSRQLISELRKYDGAGLQELMSISPKIADLNVERYRKFTLPFDLQNSKQALCAFSGDVYGAMDVDQYGAEDFKFAQDHLRILSGLYGCLRPLDLMQPYRLEMKTKLANKRGPDLYAFWGRRITESINAALTGHEHKVVVNLASQEYFKAVDRQKLAGTVLTINFKEIKDGKARVVAIFAKRARGMMADFIVRRQIDAPVGLQEFTRGGYRFAEGQSTQNEYIFVQSQPL